MQLEEDLSLTSCDNLFPKMKFENINNKFWKIKLFSNNYSIEI